jgi:hypothetical protein
MEFTFNHKLGQTKKYLDWKNIFEICHNFFCFYSKLVIFKTIKMRYRLNPEAKRALLEQAMRIRTQTDDYSNVFAKLLVSFFIPLLLIQSFSA